MRNECNIIRDILPLYAEDMVSPDTVSYVEEHLKSCGACRREYEQAKEPGQMKGKRDAVPLLKLRKKMAAKKIQTILLTAVFVAALLVSAFAVLDAPVYLPYSEGLVTAEPVGDSGLCIIFDEEVTEFDYTLYPDPDGGSFYYCEVQAWTSLWDKWFSDKDGKLSAIVFPKEPFPIKGVYLPNDGNENICFYGDADYEGGIILPRLSLGYYLFLAVAALVALAIAWLAVKKKAELRACVERIGLYPIAYIISHCIVSGFRTASYSLPRDFFLIVFLSLLLYSGLLLAYGIWRLKKELKKIDPPYIRSSR